VPDRRWGLTLPLPAIPLASHEDYVRRAEAAGYTDLWSGETQGPDGFTPLTLAAAWTDRPRLGTGIVGVFTRGPALLAQQAASLQDASGGRFVLGIGSSSNVIVERWNQIEFERPLARVSATIDVMREVLSGGRGPGGFKLEQPPDQPVPIVVAALRGRMLELAAAKADGAFTNFLPLSALPQVFDPLAGVGEDFEMLCRFFCLPGDREEVEPIARWMFASYATVPVYEAFFRWLGYGERIDPMVEAWRAKDRHAAIDAAPWDLIEEIFVFGEPAEMRRRIERFVGGGITLPILTPITTPERMGDLIEALAPPDTL
jgi:probable F420-dependent oxidoreductase